jgi:hypothetical protein
MTTIARQNTLFISEDWIRIYEALQNVDFRAADFDTIVAALVNYIQTNYPDSFNDWIASSEFVMKVEILAWLSQNIAFRVDLNTRENFLATAERRESLLRLAYNIAYKVNRATGASGDVKIVSIKTNEAITDSSNTLLQNKEIVWNSSNNQDWYEQFILILNSAFQVRNPFGKPINQFTSSGSKVTQYRLNSVAPSSGVYPFTASVAGSSLGFEIYNSNLDETSGAYDELTPNPTNIFSLFYKSDGKGNGSPGSGFFLPIKQGTLAFQDVDFTTTVINRAFIINTASISNDDVFVEQLDGNGNVLAVWTLVDTVFGESVAFNTLPSTIGTIYEIDTLTDDRVVVRFGDGNFGQIPLGKFRFWFRTVSASPQFITPDAITNNVVTLPYVSNNQLYYITLKYSLQTNIVNAAASDTNQSIRTRANKVAYSQNRMITGRDYNSFFLKDNAIIKVKTVNRTFSGHSAYAKLSDPTGLYSNVNLYANDGRLYQSKTLSAQFVLADLTQLPAASLHDTTIRPLIRKEDKNILYYNSYNELYVTGNAIWSQTSTIGAYGRGNIDRSSTPQSVGTYASTSDNLFYLAPNAVVRINTPLGSVAAVEKIVNAGTAADGIILRTIVPNGSKIISVMPPLRTEFVVTEDTAIVAAIVQKLDFGVSWNQITQGWQIITYNNLDKTSDFSLANQGDTTGGYLDASWMFYMEFVPGGDQADQWEIIDRGLGVFFESARDISFYFASNDPVVDPVTGRSVSDNVAILAQNESRDSLNRRGLNTIVSTNDGSSTIQYVGDNARTNFNTSVSPINTMMLVVEVNGALQSYLNDFTINSSPSGDSVVFFTAPALNADIRLHYGNDVVYAAPSVAQVIGTGTATSFPLTATHINQANSFVFVTGVMKTPGIDFNVGLTSTASKLNFTSAPANNARAEIYWVDGIDSPSFVVTTYVGDGATTQFDLNALNQTTNTVLVAVNGVVQNPTYTVGTHTASTDRVTLVSAPANSAVVLIYAARSAYFSKTKWNTFTGDGTTTTFTMTGLRSLVEGQVMVFVSGVLKEATYSTVPAYSITNGNQIHFVSAPSNGAAISVFVIAASVGGQFNPMITQSTLTTLPSGLVTYLGKDAIWFVEDLLYSDDGYVNPTGLFVIPADTQSVGNYDEPFLFKDLVLMDGVTDLVLWQKIDENGATRWLAINDTTSPAGTYALSAFGGPVSGGSIGASADGDIHYDVTTGLWIVANGTSGLWGTASDQTLYRFEIGRDDLSFTWSHYAPDANRIDPSISNIMDCFILTSTFYEAYTNWIFQNGATEDEPVPSTPEDLRLQFADFDNFKAESDSIIYYPARFKTLFGSRAPLDLQGTFKVIQSSGSLLSENDLVLQILSTIDNYFAVSNWDFGESFYLTELLAYIHRMLAPDVQSIVVVPVDTTQSFGRLFQIQTEPDQLFISVAVASDVVIVDSFSDSELRIFSS